MGYLLNLPTYYREAFKEYWLHGHAQKVYRLDCFVYGKYRTNIEDHEFEWDVSHKVNVINR